MKETSDFRARNKFPLQVVAFSMILLPTPLLFVSALSGLDIATWFLMGIVGVGMVISLWVS